MKKDNFEEYVAILMVLLSKIMYFARWLFAFLATISSQIIFLGFDNVILDDIGYLAFVACHLILVIVRNRSVLTLLDVIMITLALIACLTHLNVWFCSYMITHGSFSWLFIVKHY